MEVCKILIAHAIAKIQTMKGNIVMQLDNALQIIFYVLTQVFLLGMLLMGVPVIVYLHYILGISAMILSLVITQMCNA